MEQKSAWERGRIRFKVTHQNIAETRTKLLNTLNSLWRRMEWNSQVGGKLKLALKDWLSHGFLRIRFKICRTHEDVIFADVNWMVKSKKSKKYYE